MKTRTPDQAVVVHFSSSQSTNKDETTGVVTMSGQTLGAVQRRKRRMQRQAKSKEISIKAEAQRQEMKTALQQDGLWSCPETGCVRVYVKQAWLRKHIADGDHTVPLQSTLTQRYNNLRTCGTDSVHLGLR